MNMILIQNEFQIVVKRCIFELKREDMNTIRIQTGVQIAVKTCISNHSWSENDDSQLMSVIALLIGTDSQVTSVTGVLIGTD